MKGQQAPFEVAKSHDAIYVRICGLGNMKTAPTLEGFAERTIEEGARQFVFDFEQCDGVDSTFMGLILTIANRVKAQGNGAPPRGTVLINVDAHALKQLTSVGLDAFVTIKPGTTTLPDELKLTELSAVEASDRDRLKLVVRAHRELVAADARNKAKFGAFLEGIVAELE